MHSTEQFKNEIAKIKGKTIAIVYIFEGDTSYGFEHFYIWKSNIISKWMNAVQELYCLPLIIDVRTFVDKAMNNTLPHIDYVLNLNSGTYNLSTMALVPAVCSSIDVPCIPCNAVSIVTGENKQLSNLISNSIGLHVPKSLDKTDNTGIFRPMSLGNSLGVIKGNSFKNNIGIYQEFIKGYEITTPLVYNALERKMELLPTIIFIPENNDLNWFYGEKDKKKQQGYKFQTIKVDSLLGEKYIELSQVLSLQTFCRIDARIRCNNLNDLDYILEHGASFKDTYFIEINVMPTIRDNNSFCHSFLSVKPNQPIYKCIQMQREIIGTVNINSFLLASSMMSFIKDE